MALSDEDRRRYARHIMLPEIGESGQEALANASVLVVGAGGLGSAVIAYLAAAGVGHIGIIDHDHVELSNLQRQIIHEQTDQGRLKVESAADRISELNANTEVTLYPRRLTAELAARLIPEYDIVVDGSDNFATRLAVNSACAEARVPLVSGAVRGFEGQVLVCDYIDGHGCYQCLIPTTPAEANRCSEVGVAGPVCGVIGSLQALEVLKHLVGLPTLAGTLLRYETITHRQHLTLLPRDPACPICQACESLPKSA